MTITTTSQIPAGDRLSEHYCSTCGDPFEAPFASMACQCEAEAEVVERPARAPRLMCQPQ